jgi:hypothetical protein
MHLTGLRWHQAVVDLHIEPGRNHRLSVDGHEAAAVPNGASGHLTVIAHAQRT